jgi:hypothetical protein
VTDYLGLSASTLHTQLQSGKTLAAVAAAQGKSVSGLEDAIVADGKDAPRRRGRSRRPDRGAGEQPARRPAVPRPRHRQPPVPARGGGHGTSPLDISALTTCLGVSASDLKSELASGESLAGVAAAQGKSVSGLDDAIVTAVKTHLDAEVAAGNVTWTVTEESTRLSDLQSHVADVVNRTGPPAGGPGGPGLAPRWSA